MRCRRKERAMLRERKSFQESESLRQSHIECTIRKKGYVACSRRKDRQNLYGEEKRWHLGTGQIGTPTPAEPIRSNLFHAKQQQQQSQVYKDSQERRRRASRCARPDRQHFYIWTHDDFLKDRTTKTVSYKKGGRRGKRERDTRVETVVVAIECDHC